MDAKRSFRQVLADSHIAAIAAAVLTVWSIYEALNAVAGPLASAATYLVTAVAIAGIPSYSLSKADILTYEIALGYLVNALLWFASASILTRWAYRTGPLRALKSHLFPPRRQNV